MLRVRQSRMRAASGSGGLQRCGGGGWGRGVDGRGGGELYLHVGPARLLPLLKLFPQQQQTEKERAGVARATDIRGIKEPMVVRRNTLKHGGISQDMLEERKTGTAKWRRCICGVKGLAHRAPGEEGVPGRAFPRALYK